MKKLLLTIITLGALVCSPAFSDPASDAAAKANKAKAEERLHINQACMAALSQYSGASNHVMAAGEWSTFKPAWEAFQTLTNAVLDTNTRCDAGWASAVNAIIHAGNARAAEMNARHYKELCGPDRTPMIEGSLVHCVPYGNGGPQTPTDGNHSTITGTPGN